MADVQNLANLVQRLETAVQKLEGSSYAPSSSSSGSTTTVSSSPNMPSHPSLQAYDQWIANSVDQFIQNSNKIGGELAKQAELLIHAIAEQRLYVGLAARCSKPKDSKTQQELLAPTSNAMTAISSFRDANRRSKQFNHLSAVSEGIPCLGWVCIDKTPCPYIKEMKDAALFYANRVLKEFKGVDDKHVNWVKSLNQMFDDLQAYVKQHHTTGVAWNVKGEPATLKQLKEKPKKAQKPGKGGSAPAPPPPSGPAPPPPPPPAADFTPAAPVQSSENNAGKMFAEIQALKDKAGEGLKQTYKKDADGNKILVGAPPKTKGAPQPVVRKTAPKYGSATQAKKPARFELEGGKKWFVENQSDNHKIEIEATMSQTVYIFKCEKSTIQIHGKCNSITVDSCKKINVVFDNVISQLDVVNCQSVKAQVMGKVSSVQVDKCDGFDMYLSKESINAEFVTAKSSALNISVPMEVDDMDDFKEFAVPEQFKTIWNGKKFVTTMAEQ